MVKFTAPQEGASQNSSRGSIGVRQPKSTRLASYNEMATSSSSDDELDDGSAVKIVKVGDATMTLELVLPVGTHPGQPIEFVTPAGKVKIIVPSGVMPRRKFRVDVVPGSVADATLPSRSTHSSDRAGSTDDRSDSSDDGLADAQTKAGLDDAKVKIELVLPAGVPPGALIRFKAPVGMPDGIPRTITVTTPPKLGPGRKLIVTTTRPVATSSPIFTEAVASDLPWGPGAAPAPVRGPSEDVCP